MAEVIMPKMGDAMTEGKILRWIKRPGDQVTTGEAIAEIETDKVNVELTAEETGVLTQIVVREGSVAPVGGAIAMIGRPGETPVAAGPPPKTSPQAPSAAPTPPAPTAPARPPAAPSPPAPVSRAPADDRLKASPLAKRMAAEQGIDLTQVPGTGPEGRITKEDVEAYLATLGKTIPVAPAAGPVPARTTTPTAAPSTPGADVALTRMRQTIARRMSESKQQAPHFYVTVEILMDEAAALRERLNMDLGDKVVSLNDVILKAAAMALRAFPNLNASFMGETVRRHDAIHMGFALALPEGLIVPVIRDCDRKTIAEIAREASDLGERARTGELHPSQLQGSTFTVSNLGMFDVESFIAIINPPQAAILAVGSARAQPVADGSKIRVARVMKATISADHRVTDGAEAARYLSELKRLLQSPASLLG